MGGVSIHFQCLRIENTRPPVTRPPVTRPPGSSTTGLLEHQGLQAQGAGGGRYWGVQCGSALKIAIHRSGSSPPLGYRPHDERLATTSITGNKHPRKRRSIVLITRKVPMFIDCCH